MSSTTFINDLTEGPVASKLLRFALPFILANALQTVYSMVDSIIVGQFVGADALAAVTNGGQLTDLYMMFCMGFATSAQVLIAQYVGRKEYSKVNRVIGTTFSVLLISAVILTIFCAFTADWQLSLLKIPAESMPHAQRYFRTCSAGLIFIYGYNAVSNVLRGLGDSKHPLIFIAIASCTNLVLDLIFVAGLGMGAFGAALATILGQALSFLTAIIYLYRHKEAMCFDFKLRSFIPEMESTGLLFRLGIPHAIQTCAISFSMLYINSCINAYGVAVAAISGIGTKLEGLIRVVSSSMGNAGSAMIAQCMGAKKHDRVKKVVKVNLIVVESAALFFSLIIFFFTRQVLGLFTTDESVLALAPIFRGYSLAIFLSYGLRNPFSSVVNGIGFASLGLFSGLMDGVVARIGLAVLFGNVMGFGILGFWYGSAAAGYVSALINMIYYFSGKWKTYRLIKE